MISLSELRTHILRNQNKCKSIRIRNINPKFVQPTLMELLNNNQTSDDDNHSNSLSRDQTMTNNERDFYQKLESMCNSNANKKLSDSVKKNMSGNSKSHSNKANANRSNHNNSIQNRIQSPHNSIINSSNHSNLPINDSGVLVYSEGEVIDLPDIFRSIFQNTEQYYIYGNKKTDSFLSSILLGVKRDFILKNKRQRSDYLRTIRKEMALILDSSFKKHKYSKMKFKRTDMLNGLLNSDYFDKSNITYSTDYFKINLIILNLTDRTYLVPRDIKQSYKLLIIINDNDTYLPILNSNGNHLHSNQILSSINKVFYSLNSYKNESNIDPKSNSNTIISGEKNIIENVGNNGNDDNDDNVRNNEQDKKAANVFEDTDDEDDKDVIEIELKSQNKYKVTELRELATQLGISTKTLGTNGKEKNKLKKTLYNEIMVFLQ